MKRTTPVVGLFLALLVLLLAVGTTLAQQTDLDQIELASSYFEPGTNDESNTKLVDAIGMAYLRFKMAFPTSQHGSFPLSIQVQLDAIANPIGPKSLSHDQFQSPSNIAPGIVVSTQASPFFEGSSSSMSPPVSSQYYLLPLESTGPTYSSTPTLHLQRGFHNAVRKPVDFDLDHQWDVLGYSNQAHFVIVSIPLHEQLYNPAPKLPLRYKVTFSIDVPAPGQGGETIRVVRSLEGVINPNPVPAPFPADIGVASPTSDWYPGGVSLALVGSNTDVKLHSFHQRFGYLTGLHALNAMKFQTNNQGVANQTHGGQIWDNHKGRCAHTHGCYEKTMKRIPVSDATLVVDQFDSSSMSASLHVHHSSSHAGHLGKAVYHWPGNFGGVRPLLYAFDYRFDGLHPQDVINFDATTQLNYETPWSVIQRIQETFPSYLRTDVNVDLNGVETRIFSRVQKLLAEDVTGGRPVSIYSNPSNQDKWARFFMNALSIFWIFCTVMVPLSLIAAIGFYFYHKRRAQKHGTNEVLVHDLPLDERAALESSQYHSV